MLNAIQRFASNISEGSQRALNSNAGRLAASTAKVALNYLPAALGLPPFLGEFLDIAIKHGAEAFNERKSSFEEEHPTKNIPVTNPAAVAIQLENSANANQYTSSQPEMKAVRFAKGILFQVDPEITCTDKYNQKKPLITGIALSYDLQTGKQLDVPATLNPSYNPLFETEINNLAKTLNEHLDSGKSFDRDTVNMFKVLGKIETMMDQSSFITTHHEATLANIKQTMDNYREMPANNIVAFRAAPAAVAV
jgi:hypothetical protein